jgi:Uncharacterized conserved protein
MMNGKIENEFKLSGAINNQLKYSDGRTKDESLHKLIQALEVVEILHGTALRVKNRDEYFDTRDNYLLSNAASMRIREVNMNEYFVTLKQKSDKGKKASSVVRDETEVSTNKNTAYEDLQKMFETTFAYGEAALLSKVIIFNERHQIPIKTKVDEYLLCFDKYSFYSNDTHSHSEDYYEIEIESTKIAQEKDGQLQQFLDILGLFDYTPRFDSKFTKALKWLEKPVSFEDKQFLIFDIVQYSLKPPLEQKTIIKNFFGMIEKVLMKYEALIGSIKLPTGDGLIMSFDKEFNITPLLSDIYARVDRYNEQATQEKKLKFRTAIHYGPIFEYQDINGNINYAGDGINKASRVIGEGIESAFCNIAVDMYLGVFVSLTNNAPLSLFQVTGPPRAVEVMQSNEPILHIRSCTHFSRAAEQHTNLTAPHFGK